MTTRPVVEATAGSTRRSTTAHAPPIDIVTAMNSPALFQRWFPGDTWDNWKAVLKATYALPMSDDEVTFFKSIAGGREPPKHQVRELWAAVARRGGKDSVAAGIGAFSGKIGCGRGNAAS
jgi:hypothetical protein